MGTYTVREVLLTTNKLFPSRVEGRLTEQSRFKSLTVFTIVNHKATRLRSLDEVSTLDNDVTYRIEASLRPRYEVVEINGSKRVMARHMPDAYRIVFETDKLSLDTKNWKIRLGSGALYVNNPPPEQLASNPNAKYREKLFKNKQEWNACVLGINADFVFRCVYLYSTNGHLLGRFHENYIKNAPVKTNGNFIMFFPKHIVNFFELLLYRGIIK